MWIDTEAESEATLPTYPEGIEILDTLTQEDLRSDEDMAAKLKEFTEAAMEAGAAELAEYLDCIRLGFCFSAGYDDEDDRWLRPCVLYRDGGEWPRLDGLPTPAAEIFCAEVDRSNEPRVRARCLDLLWEMERHHGYARRSAEEHLAIATECLDRLISDEADARGDLYVAPNLIGSLHRALQLSCSLSDDRLIERATAAAVSALDVSSGLMPWVCLQLIRLLKRHKRARSSCEPPVNIHLYIDRVTAMCRDGHRAEASWHMLRKATEIGVAEASGENDSGLVRRYYSERGDSFVQEAEWRRVHGGDDEFITAMFYQQAIEAYTLAGLPPDTMGAHYRRLE